MRIITIILILIIAIACNKNTHARVGGPCSCQSTNYPAIVVFIDSVRTDMTNLWCRVENPKEDTVDYYHTNNRYTTLAALKLEKLKLGDTLIYINIVTSQMARATPTYSGCS